MEVDEEVQQRASEQKVSSFARQRTVHKLPANFNLLDVEINNQTSGNDFCRPDDHTISSLGTPLSASPPPKETDSFSSSLRRIGLHGRQKEQDELKAVFSRMTSPDASSSEVFLVSGVSGTGKSALVESMRLEVATQNNGYFCTGKFEQFTQRGPFSAVTAAFSDLIDLLCEREDADVIGKRLREALGAGEIKIMANLLSNLTFLTGRDGVSEGDEHDITSSKRDVQQISGGRWAQAFIRFTQLCRLFLKTIAKHLSNSSIIVLALDDVQWADEESLSIMKALATDLQSKNILHLWAYRSAEGGGQDKMPPDSIQSLLQLSEEESVLPFDHMEIGPIELVDVGNIIGRATGMQSHLTLELAQVVHNKTLGNAYFVLQFLEMLHKEGFFEVIEGGVDGSKEYSWNIHQIVGGTNVCDNVVVPLMKKIHRLPLRMVRTLQVASCLGFHFDLTLLEPLVVGDEVNTDKETQTKTRSALYSDVFTLLGEGLIEQIIGAEHRFKFSHDRVQQCVYEMIPADVRNIFHLQNGRFISLLLGALPLTEQDAMIFLAVDQYNRGVPHITNDDERLLLAKLNLRASISAKEKASFHPASVYVNLGLSLIDPNSMWEEQYHLTLKLASMAAHVQCALGNFATSDKFVEMVLENAKTIEDKEAVYYTKLESLGLQSKQADALALGRSFLMLNGERVPKKPNLWNIIQEIALIKALEFTSSEELLARRPMDAKNFGTMKTLMIMVIHAYLLNDDEALPYYLLRMMRCTLNHGLSPLTSCAYTGYAMALKNISHADSQKYAVAAMTLLDQSEPKQIESFSLMLLHSHLVPWFQQMQLSQLWRSYESGINEGDVYFSYFGAVVYVCFAVVSGVPLKSTVIERSESLCKEMLAFNQNTAYTVLLPYWQMACNFMNLKPDPAYLAPEVMDQEKYLAEADRVGLPLMTLITRFCRMVLAVFFGDHSAAVELLDYFATFPSFYRIHVTYMTIQLCVGMTCVESLRRKPKKSSHVAIYRRRLNSVMRWMERQLQGNAVALESMLKLLEAEVASIDRFDQSNVVRLYDNAIDIAQEHDLRSIEALANERAGVFLLSKADQEADLAEYYISNAIEAYGDWEATGKIEQLHSRYPNIVSP